MEELTTISVEQYRWKVKDEVRTDNRVSDDFTVRKCTSDPSDPIQPLKHQTESVMTQ